MGRDLNFALWEHEMIRIDYQSLKANHKYLSLAALAVSVLLWAVSLPGVRVQEMTDIGLLSVLPVTYYIALIVVTVSFCLNVFQKEIASWMLPAHIILLILMFHGTPNIVYGTLRYTWAWKHVGIVDYILRNHQVDPNNPLLMPYQNWPGFFAVNALFVEIAGLDSAASYAGWAPVFNNLFFVGGLITVLRSLTLDRRVVWLAAWFFVLTNWVGQDYFSPQAFGFSLYLVFLGILLHWFKVKVPPDRGKLKRWLRIERIVSIFDRLFQRTRVVTSDSQASPVQRTILMAVVIMIMFVVTMTHQLTPIMMINCLVILVVMQRITTPGLMVLMIVLENIWVWFFAFPFVGQNIHSILASFGMIDNNFSQNFINLAQVSPGQVLVAWMGRGLTALAFLLGGLGFLRRFRRGYIDLTAFLLMITPISLLVANSYGGEILFRVYFFALPFLALFAAFLFIPDRDFQPTRRTSAGIAVLSMVLMVGFLFAYYGKERQYYFTPQEISAAKYLFDTAPSGSLIIEESGNYPSYFLNYEYFFHLPIALEPLNVRERIIQQPVAVLSNWMANPDYTATYFFVTRSQKAEIEMEGELPPGAATKIELSIAESGLFKVIYQNDYAAIYVLKDRSQ